MTTPSGAAAIESRSRSGRWRRQHLTSHWRSQSRRAVATIASSLLLWSVAALSTHQPLVTAQTTVVQSASPTPGFGDALKMIRDLLDRGRGIEAENVARALLTRIESIRGRDVLEVAEVLDVLGRAVRRSSKVADEEKREFAERSVAIRENLLGPWHPDLATSLVNLAIQRTLAADPASAKPLVERALAIREQAFGSSHLAVAATLQSLAGVLMTVRDDAGARALLERALRIREANDGAHHPETIQAYFKVAIFYAELNDYTGARQQYERALSLAENALSANHPLVYEILPRLAIVLSEGAADYAGAARLNERLLAALERTYGLHDPRLTLPLGNLAVDLRDLGDYAAARAAAGRSLAIAERAFGPKHPQVAGSLHTLATILAAQGVYDEATRAFERATRINEEVLRPSDAETRRAGWFIPDLFPLSGYGSDDTILFEQVVAAREKKDGLALPSTADTLTNLAASLSSAEDYRRTQPLFERALAAQESIRPGHPGVATAATNLASVLVRAGDVARAELLYERALSIYEKSLGPDHPKVATALLNLARLRSTLGNYEEARPLLRRALAIQQKSLGAEHPDVAATLSSLAEVAARAGAITEAFETATEAEALRREHVRLASRVLAERQALTYASSGAASLDVMLSVASERPDDGLTATTAWNAVLRARGMVLDEMADRHRVAGAAEDRETAALVTTLASARQRLAAAVVRGIRDDVPERYRRLLDEARSAKDRAERTLAERSVAFREDQSRSLVSVSDVVAALPPDSALVGFVRYGRRDLPGVGANTATLDAEPSYLAFVLRSGVSVPRVVPLGSAAGVESVILRWRQQLDREAMAGGRTSRRGEAAYRHVAGELRQQVWDPLLLHISDATRVFVVPDGALHLVSFAALPTATPRYLVESGPVVHYLSTERDLIPGSTRQTGAGLLALGAPAFDEHDPSPRTSRVSFRGARSLCSDLQSIRFDSLPDSLTEVDQVVTLWNQAHSIGARAAQHPTPSPSDTIQLTGVAASESAFKTGAQGRRVLHLATHGFFLGGPCASAAGRSGPPTPLTAAARITRENPLLLSGLILAGANHRSRATPDQDDGVLTAEEVAALNLDGVEWAVLSGCDTGAGEVRVGEGVFGLRRAFHAAGVSTVIMSLWSVEDKAARQWMTTLYGGRFIRKLSTADAVWQASLRMLRQRRANGLSAHPLYWAAFVAAGDWR